MEKTFLEMHSLKRTNDHYFNRYCSCCDKYISRHKTYYANSLENFCTAKHAYIYYNGFAVKKALNRKEDNELNNLRTIYNNI